MTTNTPVFEDAPLSAADRSEFHYEDESPTPSTLEDYYKEYREHLNRFEVGSVFTGLPPAFEGGAGYQGDPRLRRGALDLLVSEGLLYRRHGNELIVAHPRGSGEVLCLAEQISAEFRTENGWHGVSYMGADLGSLLEALTLAQFQDCAGNRVEIELLQLMPPTSVQLVTENSTGEREAWVRDFLRQRFVRDAAKIRGDFIERHQLGEFGEVEFEMRVIETHPSLAACVCDDDLILAPTEWEKARLQLAPNQHVTARIPHDGWASVGTPVGAKDACERWQSWFHDSWSRAEYVEV